MFAAGWLFPRLAGLCLLLILNPTGVFAQVGVLSSVVTATETTGAQFFKTMSFTVPAGNSRLLVVSSGGGGNNGVLAPSVTFNGAALTEGVTTTAGSTRTGIWYLPLGTSGSATTANIVVTYNANFFFNVMAVAFDGVDQTTPVSGVITGFAATLSVTSRTGDCTVDAIVGSGSGVAVSSGQTISAKSDNLVFNGDPDSGFSASPGAASVTMGWSGFTAGIGHVGLNVRQLATPVSITTASLVSASVGSTYLDVVSATGGIGAKTFTVTSGALPAGVTLQSGGTLTGTPTTTGTFSFTVTATDTAAATATKALSIVIVGPPTVTTPTSANVGVTTVTLGGNVTADGGLSNSGRGIVFALTATNPNPQFGGTGVTSVAGTAGPIGVFTVNVTGLTVGTAYSFKAYATNSTGIGYTPVGTFTTAAAVTISPGTLPNAVAGTSYSQTVSAGGGTGAKNLAVTGGALPAGLTLSSAGALTGTPTTAGTFNFTVTATDTANATGSQSYTIIVSAAATPLAITTTTLPNPVLNTGGYSQVITATGGTGTKTFSLTNGTLPTGLTLSAVGTLSGTATAAGTFNFAVSAVDAANNTVAQSYTVVVAAAGTPLAITTTTLPNPVINTAGYSQTITATGGIGLTTFGLTDGALPTGLSMTLAGTISGTATAAGTFSFTISAIDTAGTVVSKSFTLVVSPAALTAQTITFGALANKITSDAPVTLAATASSGLTVSFSVAGPATVSGTTLTLSGTAGTVTVTASQAGNTTFAAATSVVQSFTVTAAPVATDPGRLKNLSVLTALQAGEKLTFGFVVGGAGTSGSKPLLVRAGGPALSQLGIPGVLADPAMNLFNGSTSIGANDNWGGAANIVAAQATTGAFPFASAASLDAAIFLPAAPAGNLSAIISGPATAAGTVIAEVYDATASGTFTATTPRLVNVSVLKSVGTGFTMGFVLTGSTSTQVLIRAVGPTLSASLGVGGVAPDPKMTLFNGASVSIASNDNWETPVGTGAATAAQISAATAKVAFPLVTGGKDAAIFTTLAPGLYTVTVNVTGPDGLGLVEVYEVP